VGPPPGERLAACGVVGWDDRRQQRRSVQRGSGEANDAGGRFAPMSIQGRGFAALIVGGLPHVGCLGPTSARRNLGVSSPVAVARPAARGFGYLGRAAVLRGGAASASTGAQARGQRRPRTGQRGGRSGEPSSSAASGGFYPPYILCLAATNRPAAGPHDTGCVGPVRVVSRCSPQIRAGCTRSIRAPPPRARPAVVDARRRSNTALSRLSDRVPASRRPPRPVVG